jgi:hypothetical protein
MNLDGIDLRIDDRVWHIYMGEGIVRIISDAGFQAVFSGQQLWFDMSGRLAGLPPTSLKLVGLSQPLIVWPTQRENVTGLAKIINEVLAFAKSKA